jgi:3'-phosphoadenosine 5'-phosphosulfate sulfotransferase (PAPS reductase)/FAD synthetase
MGSAQPRVQFGPINPAAWHALRWGRSPGAEALFQLSAPLSDKRIVVAMSGGVDSSVVAALAAPAGPK